jgi:DNA adenine methylase
MPNNVFPYPGNKARHSDWIISHFPEHECYVELFGGAAGVLFNKPRSKIEVYNDLNGDIPHFFKVLRDKCDELQEWLRNVPYSREVYEEWATEYYDGYRPDNDIERAGRFFFLHYSSFSGVIGKGFVFSYTESSKPDQFQNKASKLEEFSTRLRRVEIDNRTAFDVIDTYDSSKTVFYADPPYMGSESYYDSEDFNHRKLAQTAKEIDGKVIISYDSVPPMYGESFNVVSKASAFSGGNTNGHNECTEYLIMNYDSEGEPIMSDHGQQTLTDLSQSG